MIMGKIPQKIQLGLKIILENYPHLDYRKIKSLEFRLLASGARAVRIEANHETVIIYYKEIVDAFRGFMLYFVEKEAQKRDIFIRQESCPHKTNGSMLDMSRNAVNSIASLKQNIIMHALLGLNMLMLYTEDTYEVEGEIFFGFKRGRYSKKELREIDDFAYSLGIEVIPCIQTLGHFEQVLQWPIYHDLRDTNGILLAGEKVSIKFVDKLIHNISGVFRSKRIHLGMDEAIGIGAGNYRDRHGAKEPFAILSEHLKKVEAICKKYKLSPMIWSDMFFRLGSKTGDYYDKKSKIPNSALKLIPKNMSLVYWDYYHTNKKDYQTFIRLHRQMKRPIVMATGIWTWNRFWMAMPFTKSSLGECMKACREEKVEEVFATLWRDDGAECIEESYIPGYIFYAESCFHSAPDTKHLKDIFRVIFKGSWDDFMLANQLDYISNKEITAKDKPNLSKMLLWQDPVLGHLEGDREGTKFNQYYKQLNLRLQKGVEKGGVNFALEFPAKLAKVLSIKSDLRQNIVKAMNHKNISYLRGIAKKEIPLLLIEIVELCELHKKAWYRHYKPYGFEVLETRYGGLLLRTRHLLRLIRQYIKDKNVPEEFLDKCPKVYPKGLKQTYTHRRCFSPSQLWTGFNY